MANTEELPDDAVEVSEQLPDDAVDVAETTAPPEPGFLDKAGAVAGAVGDYFTSPEMKADVLGGPNGPSATERTRSALQGFSYGAAPKMADALEGAVSGLKKTPGQLLSDAKYLFTDKMEEPTDTGPSNEALYDDAVKKAPASNVAGALFSPNPLAKVGILGKGAAGIGGVLARTAARGAEGAGLAGVSGYLNSKKHGWEAVKDAGEAAKFGGAAGVGSNLLGDVARSVGQRLTQKTAPDLAVKSVTHAGIGDKLAKQGIETEAERLALGRDMLNEKMVGAFRKPGYSQDAARRVLGEAGPEAAAIRDQAQKAGAGFRPSYAAHAAEKNLVGKGLGPDQADLSAKARQAIEWISRVEPDFQKANELKSRLDKTVNWNTEAPESKELFKRVVNGLRGNIGDQVSEALGPSAGVAHQAANKRYELGKIVEELAGDESRRLAQQKPFSMMSHGLPAMAGVGGVASGHAGTGLSAAVAMEILGAIMKGRTASTGAAAANLGGKLASGFGPVISQAAPAMSRGNEALRQAIEKYLASKEQK